ncbi:MAG TPA: lysozyme, partial [Cupriavidus sp.]|nr:lysozyme [Cupriavidus sp.]
LQAMHFANYAAAAQGMRTSLWASQVGDRAERLAKIMETGEG